MPSLTGTVNNLGYQVIATVALSGGGYGLQVLGPPALPENPYFGYTFPVLVIEPGGIRLSGSGRKVYRDGVIVLPPYQPETYDIVAIWRSPSILKTWYLQY